MLLVGAGAVIGVGTVSYIKGELKGAEAASLDNTWKASISALNQLNYTITDKEKDDVYAEIIARSSTDTKVTIKLKRQSDTVTEIKIRIGLMGDETVSRRIYDTIKKNL